MYVVSLGDHFDGITLYGPFADFDDAMEWGIATGENWHIAEVEQPN